jgi:hypothetical protein
MAPWIVKTARNVGQGRASGYPTMRGLLQLRSEAPPWTAAGQAPRLPRPDMDDRESKMTISNHSDLRDEGPRIDLADYFDLRSWAKRFGVTPGDVRRAVAKVGNRARDVENYLAFEQSMSQGQPGWLLSREPTA